MTKLFRYLKNYRVQSVLGPLGKLLEAIFELIVPIVMANIIDIGIKNRDVGYIYKMGGVLVLLGVLGLAASLTAQYFAAKASVGFGTELRTDLFRHINTLSHSEIDRIGSSTLVTRMTVDINSAQTGVNMTLRLLLRAPFIVIGAVVAALFISVKLTLIFIASIPVLSAIIYFVMKKTVPMYRQIQKNLDKTTLVTGENISGVRVIRAFSRQNDEEKEFRSSTEALQTMQLGAGKVSAVMSPLTYVIVNIATMLIIWCGGLSVDSGSITQGEVIALVNYMTQILIALVRVAELIMTLTKAQASSLRILEIFDKTSSITDDGNTERADDLNAPAVEFRNVKFSYVSSERNSLDGISFTANRGETVGIIGGTGCGKSTLVNLIPRFYDVSGGEVLVNGSNVKDYPFTQLRGKIGIVPQKAVLFKGTVRENMQWRDKNADDGQIKTALEIAQALDFVMEKPEGLDHMIEQGGRNLSGGQRQRLTIARALTGSPEILILDDSASALDLATDAALRRAIAQKTVGMTVFIVSQRVSSIRGADKIIVLDDGRVAGIGSHDELLESCDVYKEICMSQLTAEEVNGNG
jgi:ATP-binding cassette subfamily B protein